MLCVDEGVIGGVSVGVGDSRPSLELEEGSLCSCTLASLEFEKKP